MEHQKDVNKPPLLPGNIYWVEVLVWCTRVILSEVCILNVNPVSKLFSWPPSPAGDAGRRGEPVGSSVWSHCYSHFMTYSDVWYMLGLMLLIGLYVLIHCETPNQCTGEQIVINTFHSPSK